MHPYGTASIASALNSRTLSLHGALGRPKSSRENLLMHAHAALLRWLISCVSSPSSLTRPPKYRNRVVWAYFCPAASMTSGGGGDPPFFGCFSGARIKRVSVFFSDTVGPNSPNTSTIVVIILVNPSWISIRRRRRRHRTFPKPPSARVLTVSPPPPQPPLRGIPDPLGSCRPR